MPTTNLYNLMVNSSGLATAATWLSIILFCLYSYLLSRVFAKAHVEMWKAWIPVYNFFTFLKLGRQPGWLIFVSVIPLVGPVVTVIFLCMAAVNIGYGFGKGKGWVLLFLCFQLFWLAVLAFGSSSWNPDPRLGEVEPGSSPRNAP
jgi:hypothetical protein